MRVLVLEDDADVRRSVVRFLRHAGYSVDEAVDLMGADERLSVNEYDVAVLDRTVPGGDAIELVTRLRDSGADVPIVLLTALDAVPARVDGLIAGADDYLVKPFAMTELVARVHALARRSRGGAPTILRAGDVELDAARAETRRAGRPLDLTAKEFALLRYLMSRAGAVVTRSELLEHCWDEHADPMSNVVDVRIAALRRRLGPPALVHTVRGHGYLLEARDDRDPNRGGDAHHR